MGSLKSGYCPTCRARIAKRAIVCPSCGEREFVRLVERLQSEIPCFDCKYNGRSIEEREKCARCRGFGYVFVINSQSFDCRTGEYGAESRNEVAPDTWTAKQVQGVKIKRKP
jgi:DnaJ-class molecular chaperone